MNWRQGVPIGDYRILEEIARGLRGVVYSARHVQTDELAALVMLQDPDHGTRSEADPSELISLLESAAKIDHPNVAAIKEFWKCDDILFLVSELPEGRPLSECIDPSLLNNVSFPTVTKSNESILLQKVATVVQDVTKSSYTSNNIRIEDVIVRQDGVPIIFGYVWSDILNRGGNSNRFITSPDPNLAFSQAHADDTPIVKENKKKPICSKGSVKALAAMVFLSGVLAFLFFTGVMDEALGPLSKKMRSNDLENALRELRLTGNRDSMETALQGLLEEYEAAPEATGIRMELSRLYMDHNRLEDALCQLLIVHHMAPSKVLGRELFDLASRFYDIGCSDVSDWLLDRVIEEYQGEQVAFEAMLLKNRLVLNAEALRLTASSLDALEDGFPKLSPALKDKTDRLLQRARSIRLDQFEVSVDQDNASPSAVFLERLDFKVKPIVSTGGITLEFYNLTKKQDLRDTLYIPLEGARLIALFAEEVHPGFNGEEIIAIMGDELGSSIAVAGFSNEDEQWNIVHRQLLKASVSCAASINETADNKPEIVLGVSSFISLDRDCKNPGMGPGVYRLYPLFSKGSDPDFRFTLNPLALWRPIYGRGEILVLDCIKEDFNGTGDKQWAFLVRFAGQSGGMVETRIFVYKDQAESFWLHCPDAEGLGKARFKIKKPVESITDVEHALLGAPKPQ